MNDTFRYDPEDIESLLMHKQFNELYPEEKEFVLRHVAGQEEYESLRSTLFLMHDTANTDDWQEPDPVIKANLMREFAGEEKKGFFIWLNSLFAMPTMPEIVWYRRPAVRYAFVSLVLLFGVGGALLLFNTNKPGQDIAQTQQEVNTENSANNDEASTNDTTVNLLDKPAYAENHMPNVFPPAPVVVNEITTGETKYTPMESETPTIVNYTDNSGRDDAPAVAMESANEDLANAPKAILSEEEKVSDAKDEVRSADSQVILDTKKETKAAITTSSNLGSITNTPERNAVTIASSSTETLAMKKARLAPMSANAAQMKDVLNVLFTAK
jgi:hypothetical protein